MSELGPRDLEELRRRGIPASEARRQLALLRDAPRASALVRPARVGDGIERIDEAQLDALVAVGAAAQRAGRLTKFVPASGAATRMFRALVASRERLPEATLAGLGELASRGDVEARDAVAFVAAIPRLALAVPLAAELGAAAEALATWPHERSLAPLWSALLDPGRLAAPDLPKALLPFHRGPSGDVRTALAEQLVEGWRYLADTSHRARFHFTVPPGWRERFAAELERARRELPAAADLDVGFSEQSPATDTLAFETDGSLARTVTGELLLRPAGHGALLGNLAATRGDLVLIKNIDNVLPEVEHAEVARWKLALVGLLVEHERRSPARRRPLRVCGVVPNTGEPGGGPFWVRDASGEARLQIVESSQVDHADPAQEAAWKGSSHFNPVDLAVALRAGDGRAFELERFVDPAAALVSRKSDGGRELVVLERPGLWNGAMAGWETLFVEVPGSSFAPVKSVLDLARPEHAAG